MRAPRAAARPARPPLYLRPRGRAARRDARSVNLAGLGPGRQTGHQSELAQQMRHQLVRVAARAQPIELRRQPHEPLLRLLDGAVGRVFTLSLGAVAVFERFLSVEVGGDGRVARTWNAVQTRHAAPYNWHLGASASSVSTTWIEVKP